MFVILIVAVAMVLIAIIAIAIINNNYYCCDNSHRCQKTHAEVYVQLIHKKFEIS